MASSFGVVSANHGNLLKNSYSSGSKQKNLCEMVEAIGGFLASLVLK